MEITFDDYVKNPTGGRSHMLLKLYTLISLIR